MKKEKSVHIHMVVFSSDPKEGYLTPDGIRQVKSAFARRIFQQDLMHIYEQKTAYRNQLQAECRGGHAGADPADAGWDPGEPAAGRSDRGLGAAPADGPRKKVYGYLPPEVKLMVDGIVDALAADERVAKSL